MEWCTIESDPGVFSELINKIGVKGVQVEEIYSLDDQASIEQILPIYGLVFLFKWQKSKEPRNCLEIYDSELYFAQQMIPDACATYALLSILFNNSQLDLGQELTNFKSFSQELDSQTKGETIGQQELIRSAHNSFARDENFIFDNSKKKDSKKGDAFHFVSYIPFKGKVYELDGLQKGPIVIGQYDESIGWLEVAKNEIGQRIQKYAQEEVRFNLMAVCQDLTYKASQSLSKLKYQKKQIYDTLQQNNIELEEGQKKEYDELQNVMEIENCKIEFGENKDKDYLNQQLSFIQNQIEDQNQLIEQEKQKKENYKIENARRKHNYIPFILELLKLTAQKGKLNELVNRAQIKQQEKQEKQKQKQSQQK